MTFKVEEIKSTADRFLSLSNRYSFAATDFERNWSLNGHRLSRDESRWIKQLHKIAKTYREQAHSCERIFESINTRNFNSVQKEQSL